MIKRANHNGLLVLLLAAIPLALALAGCAGADGEQGPPGQDLSDRTAKLSGTFSADILPLFWDNDVFFDGSLGCLNCHYGRDTGSGTTSFHGISFLDYTGMLLGPTDAAITGEDLWGRPATCTDLNFVDTSHGDCTPSWAESEMRGRLRNTRMPPGWQFDLDQGNRDTVEILTIQAWLTDGALDATSAGFVTYQTLLSNLRLDDGDGTIKESTATPVGTLQTITWTKEAIDATFPGTLQVGDLFKESDVFFLGSQACTECHSDPAVHFSWHGLDMSQYGAGVGGGGILAGPTDDGPDLEDLLGRPATCDLTLHSVASGDTCVPVPDDSALLARLRNTRMPPGWPFQLGQTNRDMWAIGQIGAWVAAGMPNGAY